MGKKTGPPPLPPEAQRTKRVWVRLTDAELAELDERRGKISRSAYLRAAGLDAWPPRPVAVPELNREAWRDLARAAGNINQLTERLNVGQQPAAEEISNLLAAFRAALVGAGGGKDDS